MWARSGHEAQAWETDRVSGCRSDFQGTGTAWLSQEARAVWERWLCPGTASSEMFSPAALGFLDSCDPLPGPQGGEGVGGWDPRPVSQCSALRSLAPGGRASAYEELEVSSKRVPDEGFRGGKGAGARSIPLTLFG